MGTINNRSLAVDQTLFKQPALTFTGNVGTIKLFCRGLLYKWNKNDDILTIINKRGGGWTAESCSLMQNSHLKKKSSSTSDFL